MARSKWLLLWSAKILVPLAAGIGIGLVLPHLWQPKEGSSIFRQLVDDTAPGNKGGPMSTYSGVLAARLYVRPPRFPVQVIRSAPDKHSVGAGGLPGQMMTDFSVIIMRRGTPLDGQALLGELELYLKELAGAAESKGVNTITEELHTNDKLIKIEWIRFGTTEISSYDLHTDGKKSGFVFQYRTQNGGLGIITVHLYDRGNIDAAMDVEEY
jgi:hypothetical protein